MFSKFSRICLCESLLESLCGRIEIKYNHIYKIQFSLCVAKQKSQLKRCQKIESQRKKIDPNVHKISNFQILIPKSFILSKNCLRNFLKSYYKITVYFAFVKNFIKNFENETNFTKLYCDQLRSYILIKLSIFLFHIWHLSVAATVAYKI